MARAYVGNQTIMRAKGIYIILFSNYRITNLLSLSFFGSLCYEPKLYQLGTYYITSLSQPTQKSQPSVKYEMQA